MQQMKECISKLPVTGVVESQMKTFGGVSLDVTKGWYLFLTKNN
jgi:hypothetical protein